MKPPFPYYGGKRRLAPWLISLMPAHRCYIEPFFGAGAVLFAKPKAHREVVNDKDGEVVNFYRMVRDRPDELAEACRLTPYARDEFVRSRRDYDKPASEIERARRFFAVVSQSYNCTTGSAAGWDLGSGAAARHKSSAVHQYIARFHDVAKRLERVLIDNSEAATVVDRYAHSGDVVYCDPPYVHATRGDTDTGHGYRHEMSDEDHTELAAALKASPASVLLSGYTSDLYDELYADWHRVEMPTTSSMGANPNAKAGTSRVEVVWSNRPLNQRRLFDL